MDQEEKKKRRLLPRLVIGLVILVVLAAVILLVAFRDQLNLDSLGRRITYRSLERSESGVTESFSIDGSATDQYGLLGDDLFICTPRGVRLYAVDGECYYMDETVSLSDPAAEICGDYAAVYSIGENVVYLYSGRDQAGSLTKLDGAVSSVRLNSKGWMAVVTQDSSYKAVITVYDKNLDPQCSIRLSTSYAVDAVVTEDCKYLAAVTIGQDDAVFDSGLSLYSLSSSQETGTFYDLSPSSELSLNGNIVLDLLCGSPVWLVGDNAVDIWNGDDLIAWDYQNMHLRDYAVGSRLAAVLLSRNQTGNQSQLYLLDTDGSSSDPVSVSEQVLSMSVAGRYAAVLTNDTLDIYTRDQEIYAELNSTGGARQAVMRSDGSVFLIRSGYAQMYIP